MELLSVQDQEPRRDVHKEWMLYKPRELLDSNSGSMAKVLAAEFPQYWYVVPDVALLPGHDPERCRRNALGDP